MEQNPIRAAADKAGGVVKLAERVGRSRQAVYLWIKAGRVPPELCADVELITGIPRAELNPKVYARA